MHQDFIKKTLVPNNKYTPKDLYELYCGDIVLEEAINILCHGFSRLSFIGFYYKIEKNKIILKVLGSINLTSSDFSKNYVIDTRDLREVKILDIKLISKKVDLITVNIPLAQNLIHILLYSEEYELTFKKTNIKHKNLKTLLDKTLFYETNIFLGDVLFSKLYQENTNQPLLLDAMGVAKLQFHKDLIQIWLNNQEKFLKP